mmetsp:Transcript_78079/g.203380  ORF Transcript_78079/g.203380 Transcript_78079/m.203380 type:complete len:494 (-) Transcript_78079:227-1708(-)
MLPAVDVPGLAIAPFSILAQRALHGTPSSFLIVVGVAARSLALVAQLVNPTRLAHALVERDATTAIDRSSRRGPHRRKGARLEAFRLRIGSKARRRPSAASAASLGRRVRAWAGVICECAPFFMPADTKASCGRAPHVVLIARAPISVRVVPPGCVLAGAGIPLACHGAATARTACRDSGVAVVVQLIEGAPRFRPSGSWNSILRAIVLHIIVHARVSEGVGPTGGGVGAEASVWPERPAISPIGVLAIWIFNMAPLPAWILVWVATSVLALFARNFVGPSLLARASRQCLAKDQAAVALNLGGVAAPATGAASSKCRDPVAAEVGDGAPVLMPAHTGPSIDGAPIRRVVATASVPILVEPTRGVGTILQHIAASAAHAARLHGRVVLVLEGVEGAPLLLPTDALLSIRGAPMILAVLHATIPLGVGPSGRAVLAVAENQSRRSAVVPIRILAVGIHHHAPLAHRVVVGVAAGRRAGDVLVRPSLLALASGPC